jgi:DNA-binding NarL/FixJ family response regulator
MVEDVRELMYQGYTEEDCARVLNLSLSLVQSIVDQLMAE